tara:strand:- start:4377 stop:4955 length:579 start_codon:yes stop_codon:yes gene_type:complete
MIIGLAGRKGSGKSTVAEILNDKFGYRTLSFATPLKEMLMAMGVTKEEIFNIDLKEKPLERFGGKSPRELLQLLGTEFARNMVCEDVWVKAIEARVEPNDMIVLDDVRFPNEAEMIRDKGGKIIKVTRTGQELGMVDTHSSEAGIPLELIDHEIKNISCYVSDLEMSAVRVMEEILYYGSIFNTQSGGVAGQ